MRDGDTLRIGDVLLLFKRGFTSEDLTLADAPGLKTKQARNPVVVIPESSRPSLRAVHRQRRENAVEIGADPVKIEGDRLSGRIRIDRR